MELDGLQGKLKLEKRYLVSKVRNGRMVPNQRYCINLDLVDHQSHVTGLLLECERVRGMGYEQIGGVMTWKREAACSVRSRLQHVYNM